MLGIQILSVTFILIMLYVIRIHYVKHELPKAEAVFWSVGLVILGIVVSYTPSANFVRRLFAVTRLLDVLVIVALMVVFVMLIENRIQINKLRTKLERIVRDKAIKNADN